MYFFDYLVKLGTIKFFSDYKRASGYKSIRENEMHRETASSPL